MTNPYAPPSAVVSDVSDSTIVAPADRLARLGAVILDGFVFGTMVYLPAFIGLLTIAPSQAEGFDGSLPPLTIAFFLAGLAGFLVWVYFTVVYVRANGQTIGKKWLKIKVLRTDGSPASLGRIFWLRNIVNGLLSLVPLYGIIDSLFIFGESRQCLHDKIADTIVVNA
jgi:uncharacterized RDD family membrane protein YckC